MNYTQDNDKLYRYLFQNRAVRGEWVRLNQTFTDTLNTHQLSKSGTKLTGRDDGGNEFVDRHIKI